MTHRLDLAEATQLLESIPGIAALHEVHPGPRFTYLAVNQRTAEALGRSAESLVGTDVTAIFGPAAELQLAAILDEALERGGPVRYTTLLPLADQPVLVDATVTPYLDDEGRPVQMLWAAADANAEQAAQEALARSEARFRALVENAFDGVGVLDADGCYTWTSASLDRLLGLPPGTLVGTDALDHVHPEDAEEARRQLEATRGPADGPTGDQATWIGRAQHSSGEWRMLEVHGTDLRDDPNVGGIVLNVRDITEQHRAEEALRRSEQEYRRLALHDPLTGLPNRALFEDRIGHALARLDRQSGWVAVLFCDLDHFKHVNDTYGHALGDEVVVEVGRRIAEVVRDVDTVARFGGDEFLVLCTDLRHPDEAHAAAARVMDVVRPPLAVGGVELRMTISVGIAVTDQRDADPGRLVAEADTAMYAAKRDGRDRMSLFGPGLQH